MFYCDYHDIYNMGGCDQCAVEEFEKSIAALIEEQTKEIKKNKH